jgi:hypothetical protein
MSQLYSLLENGLPTLPQRVTPRNLRLSSEEQIKAAGWVPAVARNDPKWDVGSQHRFIDINSLELTEDSVMFSWVVEDIQVEGVPTPDAPKFYNDLANSPEYGAILTYGAANPATPIPLLLGVAIATAAEAKSYQQSGGKNVSFDRVQASLDQLIAVLPDEIGDLSKAEIVTKINEIAAKYHVPIELN